ncbi:MAG TPA: hypothetical protein VGP30_04625 [Candidatus Limnocylindrales bacterium]|nr:hypothetical protein [Candidatus Limnocylindrales bacterium]
MITRTWLGSSRRIFLDGRAPDLQRGRELLARDGPLARHDRECDELSGRRESFVDGRDVARDLVGRIGSRGQGGLEHDQRGQVVAAVTDLAALPISGLLLER